MLQVIEYSERCVAVIGTSKDNMEQRAAMKSMKGKWNPNLKNVGGGWVFSKAKNGAEVAEWVLRYNAAHPDSAPVQPQTPAPVQPAPKASPEPTPQQPQPQTIAQAPAAVVIPMVDDTDELEGAPF